MFRHCVHIAIALSLAACQTTSPPPRTVVQRVEVPVATQCAVTVERPDLPDIPAAAQSAPDIDGLARVYRAYWLLAEPYIAALEGALKGCTGD